MAGSGGKDRSDSEFVKIIFFGNHTVGVRALEAIREKDELVGAIAHPPDSEDGVRYESVYEYCRRSGIVVVRGRPSEPDVHSFIEGTAADLVWITDYRYLLPTEILRLGKLGAVNLHPSLLPQYRGRAPINWAILNGERELGLSAHFVNEGVDTGDIIAQAKFELSEAQDVGDALEILYPIYSSLTRTVLQYFRRDYVPRYAQDHAKSTTYPARKPADGVIGWNQSASLILNLVRALAFPYPGAFTTLAGRKVIIWRAHRVHPYPLLARNGTPGQIVATESGALLVQCRDSILALDEVEYEGDILIRGQDIVFGT